MRTNIDNVMKTVLINQYKILKIIDEKNKNEYSLKEKILEKGLIKYYDKIIENESLNKLQYSDYSLLYDILDIYRQIHNYILDNPSEKEQVESIDYCFFNGFDANDEKEIYYKEAVDFIINDLGLYEEQKNYCDRNDDFNSHLPMLGIYKRMIKRWKEIGKISNIKDIKFILRD